MWPQLWPRGRACRRGMKGDQLKAKGRLIFGIVTCRKRTQQGAQSQQHKHQPRAGGCHQRQQDHTPTACKAPFAVLFDEPVAQDTHVLPAKAEPMRLSHIINSGDSIAVGFHLPTQVEKGTSSVRYRTACRGQSLRATSIFQVSPDGTQSAPLQEPFRVTLPAVNLRKEHARSLSGNP